MPFLAQPEYPLLTEKAQNPREKLFFTLSSKRIGAENTTNFYCTGLFVTGQQIITKKHDFRILPQRRGIRYIPLDTILKKR